ncbi:hypothetical protein C8Q78DRAFT_1081497 [Trametes maxima]|nr:hypothetical protein C8Q78DRAFT_1081497 [Trametes maxima]
MPETAAQPGLPEAIKLTSLDLTLWMNTNYSFRFGDEIRKAITEDFQSRGWGDFKSESVNDDPERVARALYIAFTPIREGRWVPEFRRMGQSPLKPKYHDEATIKALCEANPRLRKRFWGDLVLDLMMRTLTLCFWCEGREDSCPVLYRQEDEDT